MAVIVRKLEGDYSFEEYIMVHKSSDTVFGPIMTSGEIVANIVGAIAHRMMRAAFPKSVPDTEWELLHITVAGNVERLVKDVVCIPESHYGPDTMVNSNDWDDILEGFYPYNTDWVEAYEAFVEHDQILGERENEEGEEIYGAFKVIRAANNLHKFNVEFTEV